MEYSKKMMKYLGADTNESRKEKEKKEKMEEEGFQMVVGKEEQGKEKRTKKKKKEKENKENIVGGPYKLGNVHTAKEDDEQNLEDKEELKKAKEKLKKRFAKDLEKLESIKSRKKVKTE